DQCECDCDNCEYEKTSKIPQLDGAFSSDESGSDFKPTYKDDSADSDFERSSSKKSSKKGGAKKRPQRSSRSSPNKRKKTSITRVSDESDDDLVSESYTSRRSVPKRRAAPAMGGRRRSPSLSDKEDDDVFKSSSGRTVKSTKQLSSTLWDQLKPASAVGKKRGSGSPIHMSFSESDGSDKETRGTPFSFSLGLNNTSKSPKKGSKLLRLLLFGSAWSGSGRRFSRPGRRSFRPGRRSFGGPKSSKPGPKSSKADVASKPGPKSSKAATTTARPGPASSKIGPKSSKKRDLLSDYIANNYDTNYDDDVQRTTSLYSDSSRRSRTTAKRSPYKNQKSDDELDTRMTSTIVGVIETIDDKDHSKADLTYRAFSGEIVTVDENYYDSKWFDTMAREKILLVLKPTPDFIMKPYLRRYDENQEYWTEVRAEVEEELKNGGPKRGGCRTGGTKSKGAVKDFLISKRVAKSVRTPGAVATGGAKKVNNKKPDEVARLVSDAFVIIDKPLGKRGAQTKAAPKAKAKPSPPPTPVAKTPVAKKSAPKSASHSKPSASKAKSKSQSNAKVGAKTSSARKSRSRVPRGVTSTTVYNSVSIPFYESDIRVVTDLKGYKKITYLKRLCDDFSLDISKLSDRHMKRYLNHEISPFLFDNMYYNDYSGILAHEESQATQDVLITMKELVNTVVSISQCVDSIVLGVENELEPKPMIDTGVDDYYSDSPVYEDRDEWNHYDDEEQEVIGIAVNEFGEAIGAVEKIDNVFENGINGSANDPLSEALMKTFCSEDDNSDVGEANATKNREMDTNGSPEVEGNGYANGDQEGGDDGGVEQSNEQMDEGVDQTFDTIPQYSALHPIPSPSPPSEHNSNEAVEQNPTEYQSNAYEGGQEDEDETSNESTGQQIMEQISAQPVAEPNPLRQFRMPSAYSPQMYGYNESPEASQPYLQNPLQNPIVPTLQVPHNTSHYTYAAQQQNWPHNVPQVGHQMPTVPQMQYNMPAVEAQHGAPPPQQADCDFDYPYMSYYPNHSNIPQFDGIFDDDSFQSEGNPINCATNENNEALEQLSQGSRSEEMADTVVVGAVKRKIGEVVAEALPQRECGHKVARDERPNASHSSKRIAHIDIEMPDEIPESPLNETSNNGSDDEVYSFYSNKTLSPNFTQYSSQNSQNSNRSFGKTSSPMTASPLTTASLRAKQHSTPMNSQKCKPFSQTLSNSTKKEFDFRLSYSSANTSRHNRTPNESISANIKPGYYRNQSAIEGPTPTNIFAFSSVDDIESPGNGVTDRECQYLTTMSVEVHVSTRAKLNPDANTDPIEVIFYSLRCDRPAGDDSRPKYTTGLIAVEPEVETVECSTSLNSIRTSRRRAYHSVGASYKNLVIDYVDDEVVLLMKFVEVVKRWDPDIIVGFKVDTLSWGYVIKRANVLNMSIMTALSRVNDDRFCRNVESAPNVKCELCGRITLNLWQILRHEVTLTQYNYENIHFHVLHQRIPAFSFEKLTQLFANRYDQYNRRRVMEYYLMRTVGSLQILDKLDFVSKTSELARLFGMQFHEVYNRGSQFRVEAIMLRMTRLFDYMPVSPSSRQVHSMRAPEILPLILEPYSKYYCDPVVVLDFQSLYPSMMIAYNYCYSTCLGKVDQLIQETPFQELGCIGLEVRKQLLYKLRDDIHISPNGVVFLKDYVRRGILPKMLDEILETRIMVKNAMKMNNKKETPNKALNRKLEARQLGLKMIANFTYGYTSANFTGRMPCVEVADSIVAKGRETLERAINLVGSRPEWGGKVVYGDTDSLFVHFPGLSKEEAFKRGHEIAEAVTQSNPKPVRLKFEKVYLPCVLQTKKRYVGFSYESVDQQKPKFDAKGIETVRRDTCPAVAKLLEKSLRILFQTNDVNGVKQYLFRQFQKIMDGRVTILNDFVFAREYRGAEYYSERSHVPSKEIAKRKVSADPCAEPKHKERVPYVVVCGPPNEPLYKMCREPLEMINDPSLRLNAQYYIERAIIPALNRVFELLGHNVNDWYREMPKRIHYNRYQYLLGREKAQPKTIPQFFNTTQCIACEANSKGEDLCGDCSRAPYQSMQSVCLDVRDIHLKHHNVFNVCKQCSGCADANIQCQSIECPNLFRYHQSKLDLMNAHYLTDVLKKYF
ncbi:unnamed protein product, partial [Oppiella nova]